MRIAVNIADHCNLNCKGCNAFSPLSGKKFLEIKTFYNDCARLSELTDGNIEYISLQGGEPLLNKNINEFINLSRKFFATGRIIIYTNGILLPQQNNEFYKTIKYANAEIMITKYPIVFDYGKIDKITNYGIKLSYAGSTVNENKTLSHVALDTSGNQIPKTQFTMCSQSNVCTVLKQGKIYPCSISANIDKFNLYFNERLKITDKDYIDIYNIATINEVFNFLTRHIPFCRYCNKLKYRWDIKWDTSKKEKNEWVVQK